MPDVDNIARLRGANLAWICDLVEGAPWPDECVEFPGGKTTDGYGAVRCAGTQQYAHRLAYTLAFGPIPPGLFVLHGKDRACVSRACCNPGHLRAGTPKENRIDTLRDGTRQWFGPASRRKYAQRGSGLAWLRALVDTTPWPDECVEWPGTRNPDGYGMARYLGVDQGVHRIAYVLAFGQIPVGGFILHSCIRTRACCNPAHLRAGTHAENMADMVRDGTAATGDRHSSRTRPERLARGGRNGSRIHIKERPRGEHHGRAKLTNADVRSIRQRSATGETSTVLGAYFGVSPCTILNIVKRKTWTHLV